MLVLHSFEQNMVQYIINCKICYVCCYKSDELEKNDVDVNDQNTWLIVAIYFLFAYKVNKHGLMN